VLLFSLTALGIFFTPGAKFLQQSEGKNNTKEPSPCVILNTFAKPLSLPDAQKPAQQDYPL